MDVEHRLEEMRFVLDIGGREAELLYFVPEEGVLDLEHTFVPPDLRGSGAGGKVVRAALEYAREEGYRVRPSCSFVAAFIQRHPEYQEMIDDGP
ncbi:MAG: GNAT family N-acetyltransferase [Alkalispirochaeta sp.]